MSQARASRVAAPGAWFVPWAWVRRVGGLAILAVLLWQLGTRPFLDALGTIDATSLLAATGIAVLTTLCCAWRWRLVARGLGVALPLPTAFAAYYRSQFLNTTLPGGVLGDVHRGVRHGRDVGNVGGALRAVVWERSAGQLVQLVLVILALLMLPSPVRTAMPVVAAVVVAGGLVCVALVAHGRARPGSGLRVKALRTVVTDVRHGLLTRATWPGVVLASALVVAGHAATFVLAARTAGATADPVRILPLALIAMLAMSVPMNLAGWGPREGVTAWAFGSAGLGAQQGISVAVVYGVLVFVACLPGAVVLLVSRRRATAPH
jgi:glycosyltransferase 2 family protein